MEYKTVVVAMSIFGSCLILSFAAVGAAIGDAMVGKQTIEGMTRQPEAKNSLLINMIIMVGLIESMPIIGAVIAILLIFANPFLK